MTSLRRGVRTRGTIGGRIAAAVLSAGLLVVATGHAAGTPASSLERPVQSAVGQFEVEAEVEQVAISREGAPVLASLLGDRRAPTQLVVIGQVHGDEPGGRGVIATLMSRPAPAGVAIWLIDTANPDGAASQQRGNARGVDLNRNFPDSWRRQGAGTRLWSGPTPASEPETQGLMAFLRRVRPDAVLVFHQDFAVVDTTHRRSAQAGRRLAQWLGLPARPVGCPGPCSGTLTGWVDSRLGAVALTVELPGTKRVPDVDRAANAVLSLARWLAD